MALSFEDPLAFAEHLARNGQLDAAEGLLRQMNEAVPGVVKVCRALGNVLVLKGDLPAALPFLLQALKRETTSDAVLALIDLMVRLRDFPAIDRLCRDTRTTIWGDARVLNQWGYVLKAMGRKSEALPVLEQGVAVCPPGQIDLLRGLRHNLASVLVSLGRGEEAVEVYGGILVPWSGDISGRNLVAEYETFAQSYDDNELHQYFTTRLVALARKARPHHSFGRVLELGCGTGLLSTRFDDWHSLTGIDLSPAMLAAAEKRGRYDRLLQGDLTTVMDSLDETYDSVFSAGVLCYIADLTPVFASVGRRLASSGLFAFSVDPSPDVRDIAVSKPGEYAHSRAYLRRLADDNGLKELVIEIDRHRGSPGFWCAFEKA